MTKNRPLLNLILREVADRHLLHAGVITGPSRRKEVVQARTEFIREALQANVATAEIAKFLYRHPNTIRRAAA